MKLCPGWQDFPINFCFAFEEISGSGPPSTALDYKVSATVADLSATNKCSPPESIHITCSGWRQRLEKRIL